jgi:hypothetical protein
VDFRSDLVVRQTAADTSQHVALSHGQLMQPAMIGTPAGPETMPSITFRVTDAESKASRRPPHGSRRAGRPARRP